MTSSYVVQIEVGGGLEDDDVKALDARLKTEKLTVKDKLVRDDGSAVYWIEWAPTAEHYVDDKGKDVVPDDAAETWNAAKESVEHVRSVFAGVGVLVSECKIVEHEDESKKSRKASSSKS